ncbi:MAG: glutamate-1-semialdehyde 2,1-aminomutase [Deltaproteobacteria bacterium CG11_big_fil_rev_8_21_14_0_20_49_13]|nr:MAG: glutamate-1-semialdehyde 2,1-aminomutase [Deltaproteobacteria bacterium CG11_big_fil_rev_8_21_14_0_20_49_13]
MSQKLNLKESFRLYEEAKRLCPGGMMGIRRPYNFVEGEYPIFIKTGDKGHIVDVDGNDYIDMLCSYGPIILGHKEKEIDDAVTEQIKQGFCFSLVQPVQNELEKKLIEKIPCCDMSILVKTGTDATTCAVRIARGFTRRNKILRCGYHGWADWAVEVHNGVPEHVYADTIEFHYNDLKDLEEKLEANKNETACVIVTPIGHPLAKPVEEPRPGYLEGVRKLADKYNVVLIFDEIRTGFRVSMGGAQERYKVTPDMACVGKAMANGYPISAVVGKEKFMKMAEKDVFISSTFFPNSLEMIAALKTIEILEREKVCESIWKRGTEFLNQLQKIVEGSRLPVKVSGIPPMPYITFDVDNAGLYKKRRTQFYTEAIRRGLFIQPYHHWYIAHRHTDADLQKAIDIIKESLSIVAKEVV